MAFNLAGIFSKATGGLAETVLDAVQAYFPPNMSAEDKARMKLSLDRVALEREKALNDAIAESERAINERIADYEGTAADLKVMPILGPVMIFARGAQRPLWGFATLYIDFMVFSKSWELERGTTTESAFWVINLLVLGFLFGERAIKNILPFVSTALRARNGRPGHSS
jgi:hypothetical protein